MTSINKIIETAQINPIEKTISQSSKSTPINPSTSTSSPITISSVSDEKEEFTVSGSDPHGFDRDHDGIGCES